MYTDTFLLTLQRHSKPVGRWEFSLEEKTQWWLLDMGTAINSHWGTQVLSDSSCVMLKSSKPFRDEQKDNLWASLKTWEKKTQTKILENKNKV